MLTGCSFFQRVLKIEEGIEEGKKEEVSSSSSDSSLSSLSSNQAAESDTVSQLQYILAQSLRDI